MISGAGTCGGSYFLCLCLTVLNPAHHNFLLKWSSHCLRPAGSGLPGLGIEITHRVNKPHSCSSLVFLLTSFGLHLFLATQAFPWVPNLWCLSLPSHPDTCLVTPGKRQARHAGYFFRLSASAREQFSIHCLLCLVPASLNSLLNLIFKTKPGGC